MVPSDNIILREIFPSCALHRTRFHLAFLQYTLIRTLKNGLSIRHRKLPKPFLLFDPSQITKTSCGTSASDRLRNKVRTEERMVKVSGVEDGTPGQYGPDVVGPPPYYAGGQGDRVVTTNTVTYVTDGSGAMPPPVVSYVSAIGRIDTADPVNVQCPNCGSLVRSNVTRESGSLTFLLIGGLALLGCWLGCCLVPLCVDDCKDAIHTCPNCQHVVGKYRKI